MFGDLGGEVLFVDVTPWHAKSIMKNLHGTFVVSILRTKCGAEGRGPMEHLQAHIGVF